MSYVALYRKYRPKTFDEVIGQDHIITTLRNQILNDKVSHAYLFCGTRGTGKTSTAKIFARAVNCPEAKNHNGNPCGECSVCLTQGTANIDIVEMDAASNNGVDYARDIREKVQFPPVSGKYKVYIIDEVHMLSGGAFNALLKTMEEPPEHALFILCTTEVHKIPATILSRCMRFDFRLVPTQTLARLVSKIYDAEGKKYTADAVAAIAQAGEGSVRDCISIADRCFSVSENLTYEDVLNVLGVSSKNSVAALGEAILRNDTERILVETDNLVKEGKDVARLAKDLSVYFRNLLTVKTCSNAKEMLALPSDVFEQLTKSAVSVTVKKLLYAIDVLVGLDVSLKYSVSARILFEASVLKIACSSGEVDADGLNMRLSRLEKLPQNVSADSRELFVVDKNSAKSIWLGVKISLQGLNKPLLLGVWQDVSVEFGADNTFVVLCTNGAYLLINSEYKQIIEKEIAKFCNRRVEFRLEETVTESKIDKELKELGDNVQFDSKTTK